MRHIVNVVGMLLVLAIATAGCNTAKGFGEDISILGGKITGKAEKHTDR